MPGPCASRALDLAELRRIQWLLGGVLVFVSLGSLLFMELESFWLLILVPVAMGASLLWPKLPGIFPSWIHRFAFPGVLASFAIELWLTADLFQSLIHLDLLLLFYRGFFYRSRREDLQLVLLGLFLLVVAGVVTSSPVFALQLFVFAACSLGLLFTATIADAADPDARCRKLPLFVPYFAQKRPDWIDGLRWRALARRVADVFEWRLLGLATALFACVVIVSALLFVSIPRFELQNSLFLERFATHRARTGFNDSIRFGEVTEISKDTSVAFSVDVSAPSVLPPTPYFRMLVLDEYLPEGGFGMSPDLRRRLLSREYHLARLPGAAPASAQGVWTIYLEAGVSRYLPIPGRFGSLRLRESQGIQYDPGDGVVALRADPLSMTAFRLEGVDTVGSMPDFGFLRRWRSAPRGGGERRVDAERLETDLPLKAPAQRQLAAWATYIRGGKSVAQDPLLFAAAATNWLRLHHAYSLESRIPDGTGDPLVRWMASSEPGYCELFASGLVVLCRSAGIPARVAVGFKGGAWNVYSNSFTVRNSDAHAWCEVWDGHGDWVRVDPTPGAVAVAGVSPVPRHVRDWGFDSGFDARLNSLRVFWYRHIVSFGAVDQADLVAAARDTARAARLRLLAVLEDSVREFRRTLVGVWRGRRWEFLGWGLGLTGAVLLAWFSLFSRRSFVRWILSGRAAGSESVVRRNAGRRILVLKNRRRWLDAGDSRDSLRSNLLALRYGRSESWPDPTECFRMTDRWLSGK